jgi:endonuclease YncB( thermonuclease family)
MAVGLLLAACTDGNQDTGRAVRIFDGDSLIVLMADGRELEVRLFGIDAPERRQPWSKRSRKALTALVRDRQVRLAAVTEDAYGRTVAVAYRLPDGLDVNREMIRRGDAWVYRRYTRDPELIALEEAAREAGRGLWGLPEKERMPPWEWRRQNRRGGKSEDGG